ncbi:hypothetical protein [Marinobacter sp.]|uniref:hypothetical protein n=1 Tax=Marinobacter sp. TaxID=50741 RepID=UPI0035C70EB1
MKRSGPSFQQEQVKLKRCGECHGRGVVKPMFYEMPCTGCNAGGMVNAETGEALSLEDLVLQLRLEANRLEEDNQRLRRDLMECSGPERGYGPLGARYTGD